MSDSRAPSLEKAKPYLAPHELKYIVDLAATATEQVGKVFHAHDIFERAVLLVSQPARIVRDPRDTLPAPRPDAGSASADVPRQ